MIYSSEAEASTLVNVIISRLLLVLNVTGFPVALPRENEAVLLGAAVLGSVAAKKYSSVRDAMVALNAPGLVRTDFEVEATA